MKNIVRLFLTSILALASLWAQPEYVFSDGGREVRYRMAADEVFSRGGRGMGVTKGTREWGGGRVNKLAAGDTAKSLVKSNWAQDRANLAPVFYSLSNLPSAERLAALPEPERERRLAAARRVMTAKLLVHTSKEQARAFEATQPLTVENSMVEGWVTVTYADAFAALDAADWLTRQGGFEFVPVFTRMMEKKQALTRPVNDTHYAQQWHLQSAAFNLNMRNSWDLATGRGINMTVIDDGLDVKHEDLAPNAYTVEQGFHYNFNAGKIEDPSPLKADDSHGTSCAGLAGAAGFNNVGVIGVAPQVKLMGLRLIAGDTADDAAGIALAWQPKGILTHVSSNSWGPADDGKGDGRISTLQLAGMQIGARENRDGRGTVIVVSAGNGRDEGDDESYDEFSSSRFAIGVAAVNRGGKQSSYSESGMAVAISAFGGEFAQPDVMWTTNNSGSGAFTLKAEKFPTSLAPMNYTDSFNGTSAAAPQVSGAVALMLERNPQLGYRDVKEILMRTGIREGLQGKDEFVKNDGGFVLSHSFGAGLLNVSGALDLAKSWTNLGPLVTAEVELTGNESIADDGKIFSADADLAGAAIRVEHVELTFTVKHANRGDLEIGFASPSGMLSLASARPNDDNADFTDYRMTSVMHWGESANGKWRVLFADNKANGISGRVIKAKLKVYGTAK